MNNLTPLKAIRAKCLDCCIGSWFEVKNCIIPQCPLYPFRFGRRAKGQSPLKAIRKNCYDCGEGTALDIKNCEIDNCPIYPHRFGKNPFSRRKGNISNLVLFQKKIGGLSTQVLPRMAKSEDYVKEQVSIA